MPVKKYRAQRHPYYSYTSRTRLDSKRLSRKSILYVIILFLIICVVAGYIYYRYTRPLPSINPVSSIVVEDSSTSPAAINWPSTSQAAIGSVEQGLLAKKSDQVVRPTASTAKLITALTVLEEKPLLDGEQGPTITMTQADVDRFNHYVAINGATAQVRNGEKLTQYQLLQGTLLPSANNYADTLAVWAFGSLEKYQAAAQEYVKKIGANSTVVGTDASGYSDTTKSTADDLVRIGIAAAKQPVVSQIMNQSEVELPVAGKKVNTNWLLGVDGVIGGKTGNTDQAGGVFVFISKHTIENQQVTIVGAIQGEPTIYQAIIRARELLTNARPNFVLFSPVKKGQKIGKYVAPWGEEAYAIAQKELKTIMWNGSSLKVDSKLQSINVSQAKLSIVGSVSFANNSSPLVLSNKLSEPDAQWRITHF